MSKQNKALIRQWYSEVWEQGNAATISRLFVGKAYGIPDPATAIGPEDFQAFHAGFLNSFSEIHVTFDELIAEGDTVAGRFSCTMRHTGPGLGFAPTGQPVTLLGATFAQVRDGKIQNAWNYFDMAPVVAKLQAFSEAAQ